MHVGVDATCWLNARGYGRHARSLLGALVRLDTANHYTFVVDAEEACETLPREGKVQVVPCSAPAAVAASSAGRRSLRDMWRTSRALSNPAFDVLLFPTIYTYVPVFSRARKLVFIHDTIAERFPSLTLPSRGARMMWRAKVLLGRQQATAIATVSEHSRRALVEQFGLSPERVSVVGEASAPIFRPLDHPSPTPRLAELGMPHGGRSIAYVGGFGPHKNVEMLIRVFARLAARPDLADVRLVLVGERRREVFYSEADALGRLVEELGVSGRVTFTGFLPDEDLVVLLNLASVLALPSLLEGFGLPAVEAAACGCPVVATTASPLPELLGEGGLYVDPGRPDELERALLAVLESPGRRRRMGAAGRAAAERLTWEAAAEQLRGVLQRMVAS